MKFFVKTKIALLCGLFLLLFIPSSLFLIWNLTSVGRVFKDVVYANEDMLSEAHLLEKLIVDMETGQRGFIITGKEEFLGPYNDVQARFDEVLDDLRGDFSDRPKYLRILEEIEHLRYKWLGTAGEPEIRLRRAIGRTDLTLESINALIEEGTGKRILDSIRRVLAQLEEDFKRTGRKDELIWTVQIAKDVINSETGQRGFLLTGRDQFLEPYYSGRASFVQSTETLRGLLSGDPVNLGRLAETDALYDDWLTMAAGPEIEARIKYEKNPQSMKNLADLLGRGEGKVLIDKLRATFNGFIKDLEKENAVMFSSAKEQIAFSSLLGVIAIAGSTLLALVFAFFIGRSITNPIGVLIKGAETFGKGDFVHRVRVKSQDELALLADGFNQMAENLSHAMEKERSSTEAAATAAEAERVRAEELKKAYAELAEKTVRLERFQKVTVGRELEMVRLKDEINDLLAKLNRPIRYEAPVKIKLAKEKL